MINNRNISLIVLMAFIITFSLVYLLNDWYRINFEREKWEDQFYLQEFDANKKKIFLVGSSFVARINQTAIEDYFYQNGENFDVYNVAYGLDLPEQRINTLEKIVTAKPDIVVYGIGIRDLRGEDHVQKKMDPYIIPLTTNNESGAFQLTKFFEDLFSNKIFGVDWNNFKNPKFVSLQTIDKIFEGDFSKRDFQKLSTTKHPFVGQNQDAKPLLTPEELKIKYKKLKHLDHIDAKGKNAESLKKIVSVLENNGIQVFILIVPQHQIILDLIPAYELDSYYSVLEEISTDNDIVVIDFQNKYSDLPIWNDWRHIGYHVNSTVYYHDIAHQILEGIKQ